MRKLLRATHAVVFAGVIGLTYLNASSALAEKRVALIIGNSNYKHATQLANPTNDALAIESMLKAASFDVVEVKRDVGANEFRKAVRDFADHTRDADIAVVYYAGHGVEVDGTNYLIPVDASIQRDIDVEDETLSLDRILRILEPAKRLRLVILDACRDNPFVHKMTRTMASRSMGRGLAKVEPTTSDTLIAFAAKAGSTAADGDDANSPFTAALLKHIAEPGLDLRLAFGRVRDDVLKLTGNKQEPFLYGSLGGATVSLAPQAVTSAAAASAPSDVGNNVRRDYELAAAVGTKEAWDSFLALYKTGFYADLARAARAKINNPHDSQTKSITACQPNQTMDQDGKCVIRRRVRTDKRLQATRGSASRSEATARVVCGRSGCSPVKPGCVVRRQGFNDGETCN
jgi:uncharacterized caspase-like protein